MKGMILLIYNVTTKEASLRTDIPMHSDIQKGYPWSFVDSNNVNYYPAYYNDKYSIVVVISREET